MADSEPVFVIDGGEYESPAVDSFDMAERRVMFDLCGIVEEDFARLEDETEDEHSARVRKLARHPGFMEALMHIAYARGNPDLKRPKVQAVIDKTNYLDAIQKWGELEEGEDSPPAQESTSEHSSSSLTGSSDSTAISGSDSPTTSDPPDETPSPTGHTRSDTSPTSDRTLSAA